MVHEDLQERLLSAADTASDEREINELLAQGADINTSDSFGLTPLMRAALFNSSAKVINALIEAGSDVYAREPQYKSTALQLAANHNPHPQVIKALVDAGSDVHDINYLGETALIMAVNSENATAGIQPSSEPEAMFNHATTKTTQPSIMLVWLSGTTSLRFCGQQVLDSRLLAHF